MSPSAVEQAYREEARQQKRLTAAWRLYNDAMALGGHIEVERALTRLWCRSMRFLEARRERIRVEEM